MRNFLSAIGFCVFLFLFGITFLQPKSEAQNNVLQNLLDLPSPPPPNPLVDKTLLKRRQELYINKVLPGDDAPIEDLLAYWEIFGQADSQQSYSQKPNERSLDRIVEEIEKNPKNLPKYLNIFPSKQKYTDFVKRLYDRELSERTFGRDWRETVKIWLEYHSSYYSDKLLKSAQEVADTSEYVTNQESLIALAKTDWEKARPIVERLLNDSSQPVSQTLARWVAYQHAVDEGNSIDADRYRKDLQETVENKNEKPGNRDLAMDAIVKVGDFPGRDDWYFSLLEDETLYDLKVNGTSYTGLTTLLNMSPPEKYAAKMIELVGRNNQTIRNAAARNLGVLLNNGNPEIVKALLPWLENPKWALELNGERQRIVQQLINVELPESVSGLIFVLNEKEVRQEPVYNNSAANAANVPYNGRIANTAVEAGRTVQVEYFPFRSVAILALSKQKDIRAVPALRNILPEVNPYERTTVVRAILDCNGFSVPEQLAGLESVATQMSKTSRENTNLPVSNVAINRGYSDPVAPAYATNTTYNFNQPYNPNDIPMILGSQLISSREVSEELVTAVVERIKVLEKKSPQIATVMRNILKNWRGKGVNSLMLKDLKSGTTDIGSVLKLLILRKQLREQQNDEIYEIRSGSPLALGISACLLEDNSEYDALLDGNNDEAKTAMLGCAKLLRTVLPIQKVAENLKSQNKMLALAAERFLESEDSPQARQIVLSIHPNEAKILGAKTAFFFTDNYGEGFDEVNELFASLSGENEDFTVNGYFPNQEELKELEKRLQIEVKENNELIGIYSFDQNFIRIYKDKAVFSWETDSARYRERVLTKEEFSNLTSFLSYNRVDELSPFNLLCDYCEAKQLIMVGKQGGRRVFVKAEKMPKFFAELSQIVEEMRKPPAKLHYWLEKYVPGLEVLFEDENLEAKTVWKNEAEVKLLIEDASRRKQIERELELQEEVEDSRVPAEPTEEYYQKQEETRFKRRQQLAFGEYSWYKFQNNKLASIIGQPVEVEFLPNKNNPESREGQWKARNTNTEIRADSTGLYKNTRGQNSKIKTGIYYNPVITANGNWVIATKEVDYEQILVRINLLTNKETKLKSPNDLPNIQAEVFIPALNKMLVFVGYNYQTDEYDGDGDIQDSRKNQKEGDYYLLDVETGVFQAAKGEISPLTQQTFRSLQPSANPAEFWAAIRGDKFTEVGHYDSKLLKFRSLLKLPQIEFDSMEMYVDEKESKIYIVYEGHLLRIPLPK